MQLGAHVTRVEGVHPQVRLLHREHRAEVVQRGLRRAVAAPTLVGLGGGVGADVDDHAAAPAQFGQQCLHQGQRCDDVYLVDAAQDVERVVAQRRLRARPEQAGVVEQEVQAPEPRDGCDKGGPVVWVADVARQDDRTEVGGGGNELLPAPRVEDEGPAASGEHASGGQAEAT